MWPFFAIKIGKCKFFAFFDFFSIFRNEKISKKILFSKFLISKKTFFRNFFGFEKSEKNQRMQKKCIFRFLSQNTATIFLSHMIEMSHFARSQCSNVAIRFDTTTMSATYIVGVYFLVIILSTWTGF